MKIKSTIWLLPLLLFACNKEKSDASKSSDTMVFTDTTQVVKHIELQNIIVKQYANQRFRQVTVEKVADNKFQLQGQAQVFEATFNWVVEDGHNELKKGYVTTDAGAPEWGKFDFTIDVEKKEEYSTLNLILFEASAQDGSRQYELPIPLK
ncbi:Gmad2 immunoglobulin-like domain-containing protein [Flavobacterium xanthum]|uniref:Immunoglobulin-like domain of spore germination n=1 Tax=Flavobacterium xanthum TaxID=69322 RepID=A0A1M7CYM9_9FLAO|nr:Gmad2 immunoglobulin-like domain-containing protein [Flavobacterium xanthum]SHL72368.1 Immunoglobulin-like domain of spore germination [Flavobacterium xanthum]